MSEKGDNFPRTAWGEQLRRCNTLLEKLKKDRYLTSGEIQEIQDYLVMFRDGFRQLSEAVGNVIIHLGNTAQQIAEGISEFDFGTEDPDEREEEELPNNLVVLGEEIISERVLTDVEVRELSLDTEGSVFPVEPPHIVEADQTQEVSHDRNGGASPDSV